MVKYLEVWTDGAITIQNEKKPGGWSSVYVYDKMLIKSIWGGVLNTTSQRMELMGVLQGLKNINELDELKNIEYTEVKIVSDSAYIINCMTKLWYINWQYNGWKTADGEEVKNRDMWEEIIKLTMDLRIKQTPVNWIKVKGHSGVLFNEVADKMAVMGKVSVA